MYPGYRIAFRSPVSPGAATRKLWYAAIRSENRLGTPPSPQLLHGDDETGRVLTTKLREFQLVGQPVTLSRTPTSMAARPPEFGEQTEEVLAEFGFGKDEIADLRQRKVV